MNKLLLCGGFALSFSPLFSQQNTVTTGGDASGTNGSVSFSVGQIDYVNTSGTNGNSNEGVQQPFEFFDPDSGVPFHSEIVQLFPNPTNDFVILQMTTFHPESKYAMYDASGKLVMEGNIHSEETQLDMRSLSRGMYQLQLSNSTETISTIKIVKN